jgi:hypothetical protein
MTTSTSKKIQNELNEMFHKLEGIRQDAYDMSVSIEKILIDNHYYTDMELALPRRS